MKEFKINSHSITERDNIAIAHYLREINHIDRITPEEEVRLTALIKRGGKAGVRAKEQLIKSNLRFVVSVANQYKKYGMELTDLISEGNIGLIKAAELFDETRGFKFISYAVWWIRQSILNALATNGTIVRVPLNQHNILAKYHQLQNETMQKEQRILGIEEFAEKNGYSQDQIMSVIQATTKAKSVDAHVAEDSETTFVDTMLSNSASDKTMDKESLHIELKRLIQKVLDDRERTVLCNYYGIDCSSKSLEEIAIMFGKSRERTRQLCTKAIEKLRLCPYSSRLVDYLAA